MAEYEGSGGGVAVMGFFLFFVVFWIKRISESRPCWDDKSKRSDVFKDEMFVSFYVGFLVESQPVVK